MATDVVNKCDFCGVDTYANKSIKMFTSIRFDNTLISKKQGPYFDMCGLCHSLLVQFLKELKKD